MERPCVRVRPTDGETVRQTLAEAGLVDDGYEITVDDGWLYVPVRDAESALRAAGQAGLAGDAEACTREVPEREGQTMPADLLGFEPAYERLGDVAILHEDDEERARTIADALVAADLPIESVVNRASPIQGALRVRDWDVLAGSTGTVHREYGYEYHLDLAAVYFSPRLATERHRVTEQVGDGERFLDMFAGVGPFVIPAAARGAEAVGVDLNERAVEFLRENAERNGVAERVTAVAGDVRELRGYDDWADRLVMNLPHSADEFLDVAVRLAGDDCVLHYYDIQHEDDPFGPGTRAIEDAADREYDVSVQTERIVRSYAPHEHNVCLDVRLTRS